MILYINYYYRTQYGNKKVDSHELNSLSICKRRRPAAICSERRIRSSDSHPLSSGANVPPSGYSAQTPLEIHNKFSHYSVFHFFIKA